ncbi:hypothetical protein POM88_036080 [Heracleum sosnowskyi]|uniref:F-box domain-containing protein n=1 Tax=Heracleum sosnowskyi TaxID=360622 RepID=A0AAD8HPE0_9APIA|nr:hypothetical protein POM88_036080 [Heracleum sosnowskyi]
METGRKDATFGGMERAFSTKAMMQYDAFLRSARGEPIILPWKETPQTTNEKKKRKRLSRKNNRTWGLWATLPDNLLLSVMLLLNIVDYFAFSGVCRSWRSVATKWRDYYMERQKPLVVVKSKHAKKSCFLYNVFQGEKYKALLPNLRGNVFVGISCGYVVTLDRNSGFWLINLMTRHQLRFPLLPEDKMYIVDTDFYSLLVKSTRRSRFFMFAFSSFSNYVLLSQDGGKRWKVFTLPHITMGIADLKVFEKKIYVLSFRAQYICVMDPSSGEVKPFKTNIRIERHCVSTQLVILHNQLCMRTVSWLNSNRDYEKNLLYRLDMTKMVWVQKEEMGKYSLFADHWNATAVDASDWGSSNCICSIGSSWNSLLRFRSLANIWSLSLLGHDKSLAKVPIVWNACDQLIPYFWYFPGQSYNTVDCVD